MYAHAEHFSTSLILCTNVECPSYGEFKQQTAESIVVQVCEDCKKKESETLHTTEIIT
jgi:hypothetical protein